jgi:phosphatidate cytidylyltransferase
MGKFALKLGGILEKCRICDDVLRKRFLSGIAIGFVFVLSIIYGGFVFNTIMIMIAVMQFHEWCNIASDFIEKKDPHDKNLLVGLVYAILPVSSIISIRYAENGIAITLMLFFVIWANDCLAFFGGRAIGGPKISEKISPNKTISGSLCGMAGGVFVTVGFYMINSFSVESIKHAILFGIIFSILSQAGDLFESFIKRTLKVKDSGNFIPGHGGFMDRFDSILFLAPFMLMVSKYIAS